MSQENGAPQARGEGKTCSKCKEWKRIDEFYRDRSCAAGRTSQCRACKLGVITAWRQSPKGREYHRAASARYSASRKALVLAKLGPGCSLCRFAGWSEALQLHHLDPEKKDPRLRRHQGSASSRLFGSDLLKELEICCLLCANCHAGVEAGHLSLETARDPGLGPNWEVPAEGSEKWPGRGTPCAASSSEKNERINTLSVAK